MIPTFKNGWTLEKTTKIKPTGHKGYTFTLYEKDDETIKTEVRAKTASRIWPKIVKLAKGN